MCVFEAQSLSKETLSSLEKLKNIKPQYIECGKGERSMPGKD